MIEILIALPFLALWIGALFAALGLLFAPVAAIYCRRSARQNGLTPPRVTRLWVACTPACSSFQRSFY